MYTVQCLCEDMSEMVCVNERREAGLTKDKMALWL